MFRQARIQQSRFFAFGFLGEMDRGRVKQNRKLNQPERNELWQPATIPDPPLIQNSERPHHIRNIIPARDPRGHRATKGEERMNVNKIELPHILPQPPGQAKRDLVRLELSPKTTHVVAAVAGRGPPLAAVVSSLVVLYSRSLER